ncbi:MAG: peptidylprolyl isomerase [Chitinophagales bacterium]
MRVFALAEPTVFPFKSSPEELSLPSLRQNGRLKKPQKSYSMGVITELRNRSWIILIFIALALIFFLIQSASNSNTGLFSKGREEFASVNGIEVTQEEYSQKVNDVLTQYLTQQRQYVNYLQGTFPIDEQTASQIQEQAWTDLQNERLLNEQYEKIGITITQEEINNLVYGTDPHPYFKSYYSQNGEYDPMFVKQYYDQVSNQEIWQQNPQAMEEYYNFIMREKLAKKDYLQSKYTSLFTKSDYVPQWMAKNNYQVMNRRANFDFIDIQYATVADSTIAVTDKDMKDYFERNKNKFKQKQESRAVQYIVWDFIPTPADSTAILNDLKADAEKLKTAKNDSSYIAVHSEDPMRTRGILTGRKEMYEAGVDSSIVDSMFSKPVGSHVGPYFQQGYYKIASIRDRQSFPDSCDVKHILLAIREDRDDATAKSLADSLLAILKSGGKFDSIAMQYSDDQGSASAGGELGWSTPAVNFVAPFKDYVFKSGVVGATEIVKTEFGYHIINIKEQRNRREFVKAFYLSKEIFPSSTTADSIERIANDFYHANNTKENFEKSIKEQNLIMRSTPPLDKNQFEITGLPESKQIINWAYGAEKGDFNYFRTSNQVIVAHLNEVKPKGIPEIEDVEEQVRLETIRELKGKQLTKQLQEAIAAGGDFAAIAQKAGSSVKVVQNASLGSSSAPGIGREPLVIGRVMATEQGKMTPVIAGNRAVFVATVTSITEPLATEDFSGNLSQMTIQMRNRMSNQSILQNLLQKADIVDNRNLYQ